MPTVQMQLFPGTSFSHYEIISLLGSGGMGEVYLAHDTILDRKVALKILATDLPFHSDAMRRFIQEAKSAAALNHPHIAHIYEIGENAGVHFIALEYIDGVTLRNKIHRDRTPLTKLMKYLSQVCDALAKSHSAGIVHRDLKPENIMITREDYAKILDFGLAKLVKPLPSASDDDSGQSPTILMSGHSLPGTVMGTVGYLSPEQAQGRVDDIDHRSDIFAFGCILFEAVTGHQAFAGIDAIDSLHKVVYGATPQIKEFNAAAPDELQRIVRRCLAKEPEKRYQSIREVAIELEELKEEIKRVSTSPSSDQTRPQSSSTKRIEPSRSTSSAEYILTEIKHHPKAAILLLATVLVGSIIASYGIFRPSKTTQPGGISLQAAKLNRLTNTGKATIAGISPDGRYVAHALDEGGQQSLWIMQVATGRNIQLVQPSQIEIWGLTFSPDGDYVFYTVRDENSSHGSVFKVSSLGGDSHKLLSTVQTRVTFAPDGKRLAFFRTVGDEDQLLIANADGTGERKLAGRRGREQFFRNHCGPSWSPDGKTIASSVGNLAENYMSVVVTKVDTGEINFFTSQKWRSVRNVAWLADGSNVLVNAIERGSTLNQIWQVVYPSGEAKRVTNDLHNYSDISLNAKSDALVTVQSEGIFNLWVMPTTESSKAMQITQGRNQNLSLSWTSDGKIIYTGTNGAGRRHLYLTDATGGSSKQLTLAEGHSYDPSASSDGRYVFYVHETGEGPHIWRMNADTSDQKQLTDKFDIRPLVSLDGRWIYYQSFANNQMIWRASSDGSGAVQLSDRSALDLAISPEGNRVACYSRDESNAPFKLTILSADKGEVLKVFDLFMPPQRSGRSEGSLRWTPDGRAINFVRTKDGVSNIWSQPVDGLPPRQLTNFSSEQIFYFDYSRDGKQLALSRGALNSDVVLISGFR
ncbi:MAG TPA: protein kinase [Pyrinomonadaceae bacterium]|nr:protein kinase [Pyrinomonadaceae bacterium]